MEVSYDQYPNLALLICNIPCEHGDPFDIVADAEQQSIDLYQRNINGKTIMTATNQMTQALADAGITTHSTYAWLDLLQILGDKLPSPQLRARVLSSMAWTIDITAINQARNIYYAMFQDAQLGGIDNYNDFKANFAPLLQDFEGQDTNALTLRKLLSMRSAWHNAAAAAAAQAQTRHTPKNFEELLLAEKPQRVDAMTRANLQALAQAIAPDNEQTTLDLLTQRQQTQNERRHESRKETIPYILMILEEAGRSIPEDAQFHQLTAEVQERLLDSAAKTIDRALEDLATWRGISTLEYAGIIQEALAARRELREIAQRRFAAPPTQALPAQEDNRAKPKRTKRIVKAAKEPAEV